MFDKSIEPSGSYKDKIIIDASTLDLLGIGFSISTKISPSSPPEYNGSKTGIDSGDSSPPSGHVD